MDSIEIRAFRNSDLPAMICIWNEIVEAGNAFPQEEPLDEETGAVFFKSQTYCAVAEDKALMEVVGLYILHPNSCGRCGHIANASYAVRLDQRGRHIGEKLVENCLAEAKRHCFSILQFNAVVATNLLARHLYERLGFHHLGTIPKGFRMKDGTYEDICLYYIPLG